MPLATRDLRITRSPLGDRAGLTGGAFMVIDELLSRQAMPHWLGDGTPHGKASLAESPRTVA